MTGGQQTLCINFLLVWTEATTNAGGREIHFLLNLKYYVVHLKFT